MKSTYKQLAVSLLAGIVITGILITLLSINIYDIYPLISCVLAVLAVSASCFAIVFKPTKTQLKKSFVIYLVSWYLILGLIGYRFLAPDNYFHIFIMSLDPLAAFTEGTTLAQYLTCATMIGTVIFAYFLTKLGYTQSSKGFAICCITIVASMCFVEFSQFVFNSGVGDINDIILTSVSGLLALCIFSSLAQHKAKAKVSHLEPCKEA